MAFTSTLKSKYALAGGLVFETYTWNGAGVTTGTITVDTAQQPEIAEVMFASAADDADNAVIVALDAGQNKVKLTFTSADTGDVTIVGFAR